MTRVLVTGGHGFIGSFLVEKLLKEKFSVRCLVRKTSDLRWVKDLPIEFIYGDITQKDTLPDAVRDVDYIYHVAGVISGAAAEKFFSVNCEGTLNLAEAARHYTHDLKRFVFISSLAAAGPAVGTTALREDSPPHPVSTYGKSKLEAEEKLKKHYSHLPLTIIRPPIVYGARDKNFLLFFKFARFGFFPVPPPHEHYYSIVGVDDLVEGIYRASLSEKANGQTYFICNSEFYSFESMAKHLTQPFSKTPRLIYIPKPVVRFLAYVGDCYSYLSKQDIMFTSKKMPELLAASWICSPEKAYRDFNFKTQVPLSVGFKETVQWYRKHNYL